MDDDDTGPQPPADEPQSETPDVGELLRRLDRLTEPGRRALSNAEHHLLEPAWRRQTAGESRWPASLAIVVAVALQLFLPSSLAPRPRWLLPTLELALLVGLIVANPGRIDRRSRALRSSMITLIALVSIANASSAVRLVMDLLHGTEGQDAGALLATAGAIWLTNVIVFALWYWELDRGGPASRAAGTHQHPDFVFPQMQAGDLASPDWEPRFVDYLYLSFTNATALSPTDTMPFARWTKLTMMAQSAISLVTVALVISRAVGLFK